MQPPALRSVYRLFLRTVSASVLHQRAACANLRRRWRPVFEAAAKVTNDLCSCPPDAPQSYREARIAWLAEWNKRIDNTLALLYNSATTRGLAHEVTQNLAHISGLERIRVFMEIKKLPRWNPQDPSPSIPASYATLKHQERKNAQHQMVVNARGALDQLTRMSEASAGLTMGTSEYVIRRLKFRK